MSTQAGLKRSPSVQNIASRVRWAVRKLRSQDPRQIFRRLSYALRKAIVDRTFPIPWLQHRARLSVDLQEAFGSREYFLEGPRPVWHFGGEASELLAEIPGPIRERTLAAAGEILQRRFNLFGHKVVALDPMDWHHAPQGDIGWTRDLNRHTCFEQLGFAYRYTHDEVYAQAFAELSESWIEQCSPRFGRLPWDTPFQVGRRINAWIWAFHLLQPSVEWDEASRRRFLFTLGLLTEYLSQTLEYHSPGNHILLEAKALALCGEVFPEFAGADRWRRKGWRVLEREIDRQICLDGVHVERSTMYHRIIAGELAELWLFCRRNNSPQAKNLEDVVRRMAEFLRWIDLGGGRYPLFGDSRSVDTYYRFSAPAIVDLVDHGTTARVDGDASDYTWWAAWWARNQGPHPRKATGKARMKDLSKAFPEGGYYVSRSPSPKGRSVLVWDCGPLGYAANRRHAHADALSFVLAVDGEPLLVDPGTVGAGVLAPGVNSSSPVDLRTDLKTTAAHNTIAVDGEDQARLGIRYEVWDPPRPSVVVWGQSPEFDVMWGRHDGYIRLPEPAVHARLILTCRGGYWLVLDRLTGVGLHTADLRYHVAAEGQVDLLADDLAQVSKGDSRLRFAFLTSREFGSNLSISAEERSGELREGRFTPHAVIRGTLTARMPILITTLISLPETDAGVRFIEADDSSCLLEVRTREGLDQISVSARDIGCAQVIIQRCDEERQMVGTWRFTNRSGGL